MSLTIPGWSLVTGDGFRNYAWPPEMGSAHLAPILQSGN
jgi:hypothetical protein